MGDDYDHLVAINGDTFMKNSRFQEHFGSPFLTLQQAADYLRIHYITLYRHVRSGKIPSFKVGWQVRIKAETLDKIMNGEKV